MPESPAESSLFENKVILVAILTGFIGSIIIYFLYLPAIMVSIFLSTGIAALTYRFLGGAAGATMAMGTFKVTGSIAILLGSAYFINSELTRQATVSTTVDKINFSPHRSSWIALDKHNGQPVTVTINETKEELPQPPKHIFQNLPLKLNRSGDKLIVTPESDTTFILGSMPIASLNRKGFYSQLEKTENFVVTDRLTVNQEDPLTPFPFKIKPVAFANEYSRFELIDKATLEVIYQHQIYRRSYLLSKINGKTYIIWVVEVNHMERTSEDTRPTEPYVKFAIAELSLSM